MAMASEAKPARGGALYLLSMLVRRVGLLILALGLVRYGLTVGQAYMPHETVASIESAYAGAGVCVAQKLEVFRILSFRRLKGMSEEEIRAEHARQCEGPNTVKGNINVLLAWNDHTMAEHKTWMFLSPATAEKLVERGRLQRDAVRIRYASTAPGASVVLMEEIDASKAESGRIMLAGGALFLVGVPGGLLARRRRLRSAGAEPTS
jgi:hypothetical protein